jgi:hypothetical protein
VDSRAIAAVVAMQADEDLAGISVFPIPDFDAQAASGGPSQFQDVVPAVTTAAAKRPRAPPKPRAKPVRKSKAANATSDGANEAPPSIPSAAKGKGKATYVSDDDVNDDNTGY